MSTRIPKALPIVESTLILALALIGWVFFQLYKLVPEDNPNQGKISDLRAEFLEVGSVIETNVNAMHSAITGFLRTQDPVLKTAFETRTDSFKQWLAQKKHRSLNSPSAGADTNSTISQVAHSTTNALHALENRIAPLLSEIDDAFDIYQDAAGYLLRNAGQPWLRQRLRVQEQTLQQSHDLLLTLAQQAHTQAAAADWLMWSSQPRTRSLNFQRMRTALLLAWAGLCFLLTLAIYRRYLVHSRIIQQHTRQHLEQQANLDKLAHFGRLAQELAHEIKQPLTAINTRAYTLQRLLPSDAEAHKDAVVIRNEIKRLDKIVKDFLELARPAQPRLVPMEAGDTLQEIQELMSSQLQQEGIELRREPRASGRFLADAQQLKQVLINLIRNAAECLDGHGTITLRAHQDTRRFNGQEKDAAVIEVADTGPGIAPEIQHRIFDPFFSTKGDGTGLGLAIASKIVDKHGGNLEFETEPGKGTVFRIVLPAADCNQPHEQSPTH